MPSIQPPTHVYNELANAESAGHWQSFLEFFATEPAQGYASPQQLREDFLVRDWDTQRPWPLDPLPFTVATSEWKALESGLTQRARLLNLIVKDLYGSRSLLYKGGLPPALVFGNPRYLLPLSGYQAYGDNYLNLLAFDLGRSPDGRWRVLADWTEAPKGLGMCLENRVMVGQAMPELFQAHQTCRLAPFFQSVADQLYTQAAAETRDGITVILSPGPKDPAYFEHVYLGQYFGYPVVEGADLTVRGHGLQLKTLEGLKPVGCVMRFPDSTGCDPLYLNQHSADGVAGLVNTARSKHVHMANALGSGVVENDAFMSFLPGLCQRLLGEDLETPSIATWWAGQSEVAQYIDNHRQDLSLSNAFARTDALTGQLNVFQEIHHEHYQPLSYQDVAREPIQLSHAPYVADDGTIATAPLVLRLYAAKTTGGYRLLPGGIARLTTPNGEISKDIWVEQHATQKFPARKNETTDTPVRRSDRDLPSRTADDLFWLGRYLERCENVVRTFRSLLNQLADADRDERDATLAMVVDQLSQLNMLTSKQSAYLLNQENELPIHNWSQLLFAEAASNTAPSSSGLHQLVERIFNLASQVRERLSPDAWRMFSALSSSLNEQHWHVHRSVDTLKLLDGMIERLSGLSGQIQENMTQSYGWRLLELGRRLERSQFSLQVLKVLNHGTASNSHMYQLLALCDSAITYRARYQNIPRLNHLLHLLLLDETNPRSIIYQIDKLQVVMREMPLEKPGEGLSNSQRILLSAYHELALADPQKLADVTSKAGNRTQLRRVLQRLDTSLSGLSELVTATYFAHTLGSGQAR